MTVKEQVLLILEEQKNNPISGQEIAQRLGCTRAGVWKAVKALVDEGYQVEAVNNKGYTLKTSADVLSHVYIAKKVKEAGFDIEIECFETIDSTNSYVKRLAAEGHGRDCIAIAAQQTAGRGRRGRSFYSPNGTGVYISFLLHPEVSVAEAPMLTTMAATAEAFAIEQVTGFDTGIKWVNDIFLREKKVSGILTEESTSMEDGSLEYVVVGVGFNLYEPKGGFPEEIKDIAGSIYPKDAQVENLKNDMMAQFIIKFLEYYRTFPDRSYLPDYEKRCFCIGKDVNIMTSEHSRLEQDGAGVDKSHAHVLGINEDCHLHVRYDDGTEEYLNSGEISIRL